MRGNRVTDQPGAKSRVGGFEVVAHECGLRVLERRAGTRRFRVRLLCRRAGEEQKAGEPDQETASASTGPEPVRYGLSVAQGKDVHDGKALISKLNGSGARAHAHRKAAREAPNPARVRVWSGLWDRSDSEFRSLVGLPAERGSESPIREAKRERQYSDPRSRAPTRQTIRQSAQAQTRQRGGRCEDPPRY